MIHFDKQLLNRDKHFYLGFSGGQDSLAAAVFLSRGNYDFTLLHVKHFLSDNSLNIEQGVLRAARALNLPLQIIQGSSLLSGTEGSAHAIRRRVFDSLDADVVIAHTLNDLAETYFQNMLRGHINKIPLLAKVDNRVRPFLRTQRSDFTHLVHSANVSKYITPDNMPNSREELRSVIFPMLGNDLTNVVHRLYIETGLIYNEIEHKRIITF